jgi:hypothetical protein
VESGRRQNHSGCDQNLKLIYKQVCRVFFTQPAAWFWLWSEKPFGGPNKYKVKRLIRKGFLPNTQVGIKIARKNDWVYVK